MFRITKTGTRQRLRARNSKRRLGKKSELVSSHKWIFDAHPHNRPFGIQIFRPDPTGATLESRRDDESIPESDSVFIRGNADIGQRDSGYSVVSSIHRWPDTEPASSLRREMELGPGQTS